MAEHLLRRALSGIGVNWVVGSAGFNATDGDAMHDEAVAVLAERGIEVGAWSSRRLSEQLIADADLVLTAQLEHRRGVVTLAPRALGKSFTLRQFARLSRHIEPVMPTAGRAQGLELISRAVAARGQLQPVPPELEDIADPMDRPLRAFRACAEAIDHAVDAITRPLALAYH